MRALLLLSMVLWSPLARGDSGFRKQHVEHPPFRSVELWAPAASTNTAPRRVMLLLYGNQGDVLDPTWLVAMGHTPEFAETVLIVPSLRGADYDWARPATLRALASLVDEVVGQHPARELLVFGYSAGASRVLAVTRALRAAGHPPGRVIAVAGDILRARPKAADVKDLNILLVCMDRDDGEHTSCALNRKNQQALQALNARSVRLETMRGGHALDLEKLASLIAHWLE